MDMIEGVASIFGGSEAATNLCASAAKNDIKAGKKLLKRKLDPMAKDDKGRTPLHVAAIKGHKEYVDWLLDEVGVDLDATENQDLYTALHCAIVSEKPEMVRHLMSKGADPDRAARRDEETPRDLIKRVGNKRIELEFEDLCDRYKSKRGRLKTAAPAPRPAPVSAGGGGGAAGARSGGGGSYGGSSQSGGGGGGGDRASIQSHPFTQKTVALKNETRTFAQACVKQDMDTYRSSGRSVQQLSTEYFDMLKQRAASLPGDARAKAAESAGIIKKGITAMFTVGKAIVNGDTDPAQKQKLKQVIEMLDKHLKALVGIIVAKQF